MHRSAIPESVFPGIDITNTYPSLPEFWVALCIPEPIFFIKIALIGIIQEKLIQRQKLTLDRLM
jgi:hypothetical protein